MSSSLSTWDRERLATAMLAFKDALDQEDLATSPPADLTHAVLAAIRAADTVKPPPEVAKPAPDARQFFRKLEAALRALADPGTEVDSSNGRNEAQRWQDYWVTVDGVVWFIMCRPNRRHTVMPLAPAPERYDSLGRPATPLVEEGQLAGGADHRHGEVVQEPDQPG